MKKDKTYWILEALKILFFAVIPIALFIMKCTTLNQQQGGTKFIIGCSGYIVALILYFVIKKIVLKRYLSQIDGKIVNYETQIETETDQEKITLIENALRKCLIIKTIFTVIPVIILLGLLLMIVKGLEKDLLTLYSVIGFIALSICAGFICEIIQDANVKSKHRE